MTKFEFIDMYDMATHLADTAFSTLGLAASKFIRTFKPDYIDILDEKHFLKKEFARYNKDKQVIKDALGNVVIDDRKEKSLIKALVKWGAEEANVDFNKFTPVAITGKLLFMSPSIYTTLNGYVFNVSEEDYIKGMEEELLRQNREKLEKEGKAEKKESTKK